LAILLQFALLRASTPVEAYHWAFWGLTAITGAALLSASRLPGRTAPQAA
jgi:hypothetical protein